MIEVIKKGEVEVMENKYTGSYKDVLINNVEEVYESSCEFIEGIFNKIRNDENIDIKDGIELIKNIVSKYRLIDMLCFEAFNRKSIPNKLISNSVNVSVYSLKVGKGLEYDKDKLVELGISALLHEVGMIKISSDLINKESKFSEQEYEVIKRHPVYGYEILNNLEEEYRWIAKVILQEHEKEDGSGYPYGLSGNEIHEYAKIIGLTDIYDALTQPRPQRKRFFPYDAIKEIIEYRKGAFSPVIIKVLLRELSIFPVMSYVKLNSNEIGRVIETDKEHILRPKIEIIYDSLGRKIKGEKIISLKENPFLYITGSLWEDELKNLIEEGKK